MPYFSKISKSKLNLAHKDLQRLFNNVIKTYDCSVICSIRSRKDQEELFQLGLSKKQYPDSKHNVIPSLAVDVVPYPVDFKNITEFENFVDRVKEVARKMNIEIINGGKWSLKDYPHFELK